MLRTLLGACLAAGLLAGCSSHPEIPVSDQQALVMESSVLAAGISASEPVVVATEIQATASSTLPRVQRSKDQQERIDRILDKISQSGYDSLSTEEKAFLFYISDDEKDGR